MPRKTCNDTKSTRRRVVGKSNVKKTEEVRQDKFCFDEEIVIGLKRIDEPMIEEKKKKRKDKNKINKTQKLKRNQGQNNFKAQKKRKDKEQKKINNSKNSKELEDEPDIMIRSKYLENYERDSKNNKDKKRKNQLKKKRTIKQGTESNNLEGNFEENYYEKHKYDENGNWRKQNVIPKVKISKKKHRKIVKAIKWLTFLGIVVAGIIYAMLSPIFNINNISVSGNSKISSETIMSLSGLGIEQNIFNFRTSNVISSIKENAYIDKVEVKRKLPDSIEIYVTEREATFMLAIGNAYAYINNQGYILEVTKEKGNYPIITGYETEMEQITAGNRLSTNDLEKLNDVLKIMDTASSAEDNLKNKITKIDIKDRTNYTLTLEKENKKIEFGDTSNLSTKILWINEFLDSEKKNEGTIYLNVDLNNDKPYFREKV